MRPILIIGMVLAVFQQWCGINVIFNYAQEIFASAGFDINSTLKSIVATGLINLLFTLIALPMVDKLGRRKLMLIGSAGLTIIYGMMAAAYASGVLGLPVLLLVLAAIAIYALTLAPVTWVLLSEIFPNRVRGLAMSAGTLALWIACFVLTYTFPLLNAGLGPQAASCSTASSVLPGSSSSTARCPRPRGDAGSAGSPTGPGQSGVDADQGERLGMTVYIEQPASSDAGFNPRSLCAGAGG